MQLIDIIAAVPLDLFRVRLTFSDQTMREVDLWPYIQHGPVFALVRDEPGYFQRMMVCDGTISWPNGADIDPNVLYDPTLIPASWHPDALAS